MTTVVTLASAKGGPGKTTAALALTDLFGSCYGAHRVSVVDLDPEGYATAIGLGQSLVADPLNCQPIEIGFGRKGSAKLFPAGESLAHATEPQIAAHLNRAAANADVVIIDTPPTRASGTMRAALRAATQIVTPILPDFQSYAGFTRILAEASALGLGTPVHALFSRWDSRTVVARAIHTLMLQTPSYRTLGPIIPRDQRVIESMAAGAPVTVTAPRSAAASAYRLTAIQLAGIANITPPPPTP